MKPTVEGKETCVVISKTKKWYNDCQTKVREYQTEMENLKKLYQQNRAAKKPRVG
ncbi:hypothetical protein PR002_g23499 [Phytophthora rubi]|nr:hypothetical protein PR002_g23499 [Phytophthora rubi]